METSGESHLLVVGVGNRYRGDDALGLVIIDRLRQLRLPDCQLIQHTTDGVDLLHLWHVNDRVILIDAVRSGLPAGTVHRLDAVSEPLPTDFFSYSTHAFSLAEAVETARALGLMPAQLIVIGVEGEQFDMGEAMSSAVVDTIEHLLPSLVSEIEHLAAVN